MMTDNSLSFNTNWQSSQTITSTVASTTVIDVTGAGSGNTPTMIGAGGVSTALGVDMGQGQGDATAYLVMIVDTAFVSGGGATMTVSLGAAPDNGSGSPGTYTQLYESATFTASNLAAGQTLVVPVPPRALSGQPGESIPRFYTLTYTVASSTFSAGTVNAGFVINPPAGLVNTLYGNNYTSV